jgi:hypothetical protein
MDRPNRSTLIWQLFHPTLVATMECVAYVREDHRVELVIQRERRREAFGVFATTESAVRAAFRFEEQMLTTGWQKVV